VILTMMTRDTLSVRFNRVAARLFVAMFCLGLFATAEAFAQRGVGPPRPEKADEPPVFLYYGVLLLLGILTIAVSLIPSKRGHLD
jgi:hypothetical protein